LKNFEKRVAPTRGLWGIARRSRTATAPAGYHPGIAAELGARKKEPRASTICVSLSLRARQRGSCCFSIQGAFECPYPRAVDQARTDRPFRRCDNRNRGAPQQL